MSTPAQRPAPWYALSRADFRRQLSYAVGTGVMLVALTSALLSSWQGSRQGRETLERQGLELARSLAQQGQLALLTQAGENASAALDRALSYPDVRHVELLNANGRLLIERGQAPKLAASVPLEANRDAYLEAETATQWRFVAPVQTRPSDASPFDGEARKPELLGYVRVTQGKTALIELAQRLALINFAIGLASALVLASLLRRLAARLSRPLTELSAVMERASAGALDVRARPHGAADLARMASVFNQMMETLQQRDRELHQKNQELAQHASTLEKRVVERTESLSTANAELQDTLNLLRQTQEQLVEHEKLASLGRLVAGVAHELNTPLGNALIASDTLAACQQQLHGTVQGGTVRRSELLRQLDDSLNASELVARNVRRAAEIIRSFKQLAVDQTSEMRRPFALDQVLQELLTALQPMFKHTPFRIVAQLEPGLQLDGYPGPLQQVVTNIIQNAMVHGFEGRDHGEIKVECRRWGDSEVQVLCQDDGHGMSEGVRARIFEPFFTTRFGQGGSGLGMQIVHTLVHGLLGGRVVVHSSPGAGTRVVITLPLVAPRPAE